MTQTAMTAATLNTGRITKIHVWACGFGQLPQFLRRLLLRAGGGRR